jgi:hypothetical protein
MLLHMPGCRPVVMHTSVRTQRRNRRIFRQTAKAVLQKHGRTDFALQLLRRARNG